MQFDVSDVQFDVCDIQLDVSDAQPDVTPWIRAFLPPDLPGSGPPYLLTSLDPNLSAS